MCKGTYNKKKHFTVYINRYDGKCFELKEQGVNFIISVVN